MPKIVEVTLYQFNELSAKAKETAREWWRELEGQDFTPDYEDFKQIAEILGIEFARRPYNTVEGKTGYETAIYWGLNTQGSGASFQGSYRFSKDCLTRIKEFAPQDEKLHKIAEELAEPQARYQNNLTALISTGRGHEVHSGAMELEFVEVGNDTSIDVPLEDEKALLKLLRDFADWMYRRIDADWDYQMSDEHVDEMLQEKEYWFTADGKKSDD